MARCVYHVNSQVDDAGALVDAPRHLCEEHYVAWRDGERTGPAHVDGAAGCSRVCEDCKAELAAAKARKEGDT